MSHVGASAWIGIVALGMAPAAASDPRPPDPALILSYADFARSAQQGPVTLEFDSGEGRLLMVGVSHTLHFDSPTVGHLWLAFDVFKSTLAFYEGWPGRWAQTRRPSDGTASRRSSGSSPT